MAARSVNSLLKEKLNFFWTNTYRFMHALEFSELTVVLVGDMAEELLKSFRLVSSFAQCTRDLSETRGTV